MPNPSNNKNLHYLRYGIAADKKYLTEYIDNYGNLILNAKTVAFSGKQLFLFLHNIRGKVDFIIDPETHIFQHDRSCLESTTKNNKGRNVIRKSIKSLIDAYGAPVDKLLQRRNVLSPKHFEGKIIPFCKKVIDFQIDTVKKQESESEVSEYFKFLKEKKRIHNDSITPSYAIAPYFYLFGPDYQDWLELNLEFINNSIIYTRKRKFQLAAQLVLHQDILTDQNKTDLIIKKYNALNLERIFLWIDSFSEHESSESTLESFVNLIKNLKSSIVILYGGYFSIILNKTGICSNLDGVSHGIGFGEERSVVPVGGGVPAAKFYLRGLHKRLIFRNALQSIKPLDGNKDRNSFLKNICDCDTCQSIIKKSPIDDFKYYGITKPGKDFREYPTPKTIENCIRHYINCKNKEFTDQVTIDEIEDKLRSMYQRLKGTLPDEISHCIKWINVLKRFHR